MFVKLFTRPRSNLYHICIKTCLSNKTISCAFHGYFANVKFACLSERIFAVKAAIIPVAYDLNHSGTR